MGTINILLNSVLADVGFEWNGHWLNLVQIHQGARGMLCLRAERGDGLLLRRDGDICDNLNHQLAKNITRVMRQVLDEMAADDEVGSTAFLDDQLLQLAALDNCMCALGRDTQARIRARESSDAYASC